MITKKEILDLVKQYVETNDLDTLAHSFAPMFYDIEETGDAEAIQFAYEVESMLAAMTAGMYSESAFQLAMKALVPSISVVIIATKECGTNQTIHFANAAAAGAGTVTLAYVGTAPSVGFWSATEIPNTHQTNINPPQWQQVLPA